MTTQVPPDVTVLCLKSVFSVRYWHTMLCIVDTIMTFCTLCKVIYRCRIDAIVALPPYGAFYSIMTHNVLPLFCTLYNSDTQRFVSALLYGDTLCLYSVYCTVYYIRVHYKMLTQHTLSVLYTLYSGDTSQFVCTLYTVQQWHTTRCLYSDTVQ